MFILRRPSPSAIDRFVAASQTLPLSYGPVGLVATKTAHFNLDELTATIGRGPADFARAREALGGWKHFKLGWLEIHPMNASIAMGTTVAVVIRHFGMWSMNGCRVVASVDETHRFGFSYGTLINHAERGEELFEVAMSPESGEVTYRIRAASQPRAALAHLGYPLARILQARARRESAQAILRAIY